MSELPMLSPARIAEYAEAAGKAKLALKPRQTLLLSIMAGMFIALAAAGSNMATHAIESVGVARMIAGVLFPAGLMMTVLCGGELFTGNCLESVVCLSGKAKWHAMARNLLLVYVGNFLGSMLVVLLVAASRQWDMGGGVLGGYTIKVAAGKTSLGFVQALCSGVLCNVLVCLAVWMSYAAKDVTGKLFAIFFPIALFIMLGFEHCVANMYYIPAGLVALLNEGYRAQAQALGANLEGLTVAAFAIRNLLPVTLGNLIGGSLLVGGMYWGIYLREK